jgi:putative NIF3 family GTP cyclohydrolase 1 type 2
MKPVTLAAAFLIGSAAVSAAGPPTARQIVERIREHVGVAWRAETVDTFKAGDPGEPVTGIATTFVASQDVLERAARAGVNFVITHEPTFYNHLDRTGEMASDPVVRAKQEFIGKHKMVVWRFHDHWHMRRPDGILEGMTRALGWDRYRDAQTPGLFTLPGTTLEGLAADLAKRLNLRAPRVLGDPRMKVLRAALIPGAAGSETHMAALRRPDVDVILVGEAREWETVEYVRDASAQGRSKGLILLNHVPSEEAGMEECARWLRTFVKDVPVLFIAAGEPFWRPR